MVCHSPSGTTTRHPHSPRYRHGMGLATGYQLMRNRHANLNTCMLSPAETNEQRGNALLVAIEETDVAKDD